MATKTSSDSVHLTAPGNNSKSSKKYIIIFLTGNPGLISYYFTFLTHIYSLLNQESNKNNPVFEVHGSSLPGFEVDNLSLEEKKKQWQELGLDHDPPFSLEETICAVERRIFGIVKQSKGDGEDDPGVILVGHSLGAFISLEVIERHRKRLEIKGSVEGEPNVVSGIGLFPGVVDLGKSDSGVKLTALSKLPFFQTMLPKFLFLLICLIPTPLLRPLVRLFTRMPPDSTLTTTSFLKSRHGIIQAIYLGCDEIRTITEDKWSSEIWGASHESPSGVSRPKLFFYFGEEDHWVSSKTRDELMSVRGGEEEWKPTMEVDERGIPHGFCIRHSVPVAEKVVGYVREIARMGV